MADWDPSATNVVEMRRGLRHERWEERKHPRGAGGKFDHSATGAVKKVGAAAKKVGEEITGTAGAKRRGSRNTSTRQKQAGRDKRAAQVQGLIGAAAAGYVGYQYGNAIFGSSGNAGRAQRPRNHGVPMSQLKIHDPSPATNGGTPPPGVRFIAGKSGVADRAAKPRSGRMGDGAQVKANQALGRNAKPRPFKPR